MERDTMFMDWKNQYCLNDYTALGNLQIQCNPYQITNDVFHGIEQKNLKICMEMQDSPNCQGDLQKEVKLLGL